MIRTLTLSETDRIRARRNESVLLYLTDRCPVGCAHCSVDALPRHANAAEGGMLADLVDQLSVISGVRLVGISGGEPFLERRALESATAKLARAGKLLVVYTSGCWGRDDGTVPAWTEAVLARISCVVFGTDRFHAARIPDVRLIAAMRAAAAAGSRIAVQVLDEPAETQRAEKLVTAALGTSWAEIAEIRRTVLLARGRGADLPNPSTAKVGGRYGACTLAASPVVRYDGRLTACCNEDVVTGHGPAALHSTASEFGGLRASLDAMEHDAYLGAIARVGLGPLTRLPAFRELGIRSHPDICSLCWELLDAGADRDPAVRAMAVLAEPKGA